MSKQFQRTHSVLFICCIELWTKAVLSSDPAFFRNIVVLHDPKLNPVNCGKMTGNLSLYHAVCPQNVGNLNKPILLPRGGHGDLLHMLLIFLCGVVVNKIPSNAVLRWSQTIWCAVFLISNLQYSTKRNNLQTLCSVAVYYLTVVMNKNIEDKN